MDSSTSDVTRSQLGDTTSTNVILTQSQSSDTTIAVAIPTQSQLSNTSSTTEVVQTQSQFIESAITCTIQALDKLGDSTATDVTQSQYSNKTSTCVSESQHNNTPTTGLTQNQCADTTVSISSTSSCSISDTNMSSPIISDTEKVINGNDIDKDIRKSVHFEGSYSVKTGETRGKIKETAERWAGIREKLSTRIIPYDPLEIAVYCMLEALHHPETIEPLQNESLASKKRWREICSLPMQDALWLLWDYEKVVFKDGTALRLMVVQELNGDAKNLLQTSIAWTKAVSYKDQVVRLVCHACLQPLEKHPRKPRHLQIKDTPDSSDLSLNLKGLGIQVFPPSATMSYIQETRNFYENVPWFRSCHRCGRRGETSMFISCPNCDAVLFCDKYCMEDNDHLKWCPFFKVYMEYEDILGTFPFSFTQETTERMFNVFKLRHFLTKKKVYGKQLWRRECKLLVEPFEIPYGALESIDSTFDLTEEEAALQQTSEKPLPPLTDPLTDWASYYDYRGFSLDTPIAVVLQYGLTLYHIITKFLPIERPQLFKKIQEQQKVCVHVIGVEKEADLLPSFLECAHLLAPIELHLCLIGDCLPEEVHGETPHKDNLRCTFFSGVYHEVLRSSFLPLADMAMCFNAGLGAYYAYKDTVKQLRSTDTPTYCTDYCLASYEQSFKSVRSEHVAKLSTPRVNPFRSPLRMVYTDTDLPRYSNAIIFSIESAKSRWESPYFVRTILNKKGYRPSKFEYTVQCYRASLLPREPEGIDSFGRPNKIGAFRLTKGVREYPGAVQKTECSQVKARSNHLNQYAVYDAFCRALDTLEADSVGHESQKAVSGGQVTRDAGCGDHMTQQAVGGDHVTQKAVSGGHVTREAVSGDYVIQEAVSGEHATQAAASGSHVIQEAASGSHVIQEAVSDGHVIQEAISGEHMAQKAANGGHVTQKAISGEHTTQEAASGSHVIQEAVSDGLVIQEAISGEHVTQKAVSGGHAIQEAVSGGHMPQEAASGGHVTQEAICGSQVSQEATNGGYVTISSCHITQEDVNDCVTQ